MKYSIWIILGVLLGAALVLLGLFLRGLALALGKARMDAAQNAALRAQNEVQGMIIWQHEERARLLDQVKQMIIAGWRSEGYAQGLDRYLDKVADLKAEGADAGLTRARLDEREREVRTLEERVAYFQRAASGMQENRDEIHEKYTRLAEKLRQERARRLELEARPDMPGQGLVVKRGGLTDAPAPGEDAGTFPADPLHIPGTSPAHSRHIPGTFPADSLKDPGQVKSGGNSLENEVFELQGNKYYDLKDETRPGIGYTGRILVVDRLTGQTCAEFRAGDLRKGAAYLIPNTAINVVWCAREGCHVVKVTKHISTTCCSDVHYQEHQNYLRQRNKLA